MPLRLDIKRKLSARSDRVKSVDLHSSEPWMLASLYNGNVHIWNLESQQLIKSFEICDLPVRAARFVSRKNWIITGSDDMHIRVFNYNTLERVFQFEAHSDYVRTIAVHPTQPYILTSSDDMLIKLWDWEKKWACTQVFEGHTHYVMQIVINPKDNNTFASASLDRTVKVWQLGSSTPNFTLEGHEKGVNCVDYYSGGDKPYLISGADDRLVKIWDYQNKTCVQTLEGHAQNLSAVAFHPELPIILTGSEDGTVRIWHANTYRLESTLNYGLERVWTIACQKGSNNVALGYDEGSIIIKLGREEPAMTMDVNGKIIWAKHSEIQQANIKTIGDQEIRDGERLPLAVKDMGSCEVYPQSIQHNPNGRFVVVCGDGEYIIYTAMALRNKSFGPAQEFVWSNDSAVYAIRESNSLVKISKNFKEQKTFKPDFGAEGIYGGHLLGVRSVSGLAFYDWETTDLIRRIEITPKHIYWSDNGELVCISTEQSFFILKYSAEAFEKAKDTKEGVTEDGIEEAFDGFKSQALAVTCDPEHKFELALQLGDLRVAYQLAKEAESEQKWKLLAELAINKCEFGLAQECLHQAQDFGGLLLLATSAGNTDMVLRLGQTAEKASQNNVAFLSYFALGKLDECLEVLINTNRLPEAAFFARTYLPSQISRNLGIFEFKGPSSALAHIRLNSERNPVEEMLKAEAEGKFVYKPSDEDKSSDPTEEDFTYNEAEVVCDTGISDDDTNRRFGQDNHQQPLLQPLQPQQQQQQPPLPPLPKQVEKEAAAAETVTTLPAAPPAALPTPASPSPSPSPNSYLKPSLLTNILRTLKVSTCVFVSNFKHQELHDKDNIAHHTESEAASTEISVDSILSKQAVSDLEKELELDLENLNLDNVDTSDVNLDDDLLED
ncbi:coatomer subunit beta' [Octopus bimaculoides]|nr:coatomer subunit beta' [Octopus bimaculoides]